MQPQLTEVEISGGKTAIHQQLKQYVA